MINSIDLDKNLTVTQIFFKEFRSKIDPYFRIIILYISLLKDLITLNIKNKQMLKDEEKFHKRKII